MRRIVVSKRHISIAVIILFGICGVILLVSSQAAVPTASKEAEAGTVSGGASITSDASASGSQAVKFAASSTSASCPNAANTPGGTDPWGGCWPGDFNTGYPHGLPGDTRSPVTLTNYTGSCTVPAGSTVVIDSKNVNCSSEGLFVYGNLTIKNSYVKANVYENSDSAVLTVMDSEVDGGNQYTYPTIGGGYNVTVIRVNAYRGEHSVHCYGNCRVEDSWMHDQYEAGSGPHQNAFLSNSGSDYTIRHNTAHCTTSGCTGDITFTDDGPTYNAVIDKNLFMPTPGSYCIYPGTGPKPYPMYQFTVTNNIFKRGANNKCATYGPVYGWDTPQTTSPGTNGYMNVWSNNKWEDGVVINP